MSELTTREARAQEGVLQFAEEMQAIRDDHLYPNAGKRDAWKTYCRDRWGMSEQSVRQAMQASPVLRRLSDDGVIAGVPVSSASTVATLPIPVQDAILA